MESNYTTLYNNIHSSWLSFFEDNKEAIFFKDKNDLFDKVNYYLKRPSLIKKISRNGKNRAIKTGYTLNVQIKKILKIAI